MASVLTFRGEHNVSTTVACQIILADRDAQLANANKLLRKSGLRWIAKAFDAITASNRKEHDTGGAACERTTPTNAEMIGTLARDERRFRGGKPVCTIKAARSALWDLRALAYDWAHVLDTAREAKRIRVSNPRVYFGNWEQRMPRQGISLAGMPLLYSPRTRSIYDGPFGIRPVGLDLAAVLDRGRKRAVTDCFYYEASNLTVEVDWVDSPDACDIQVETTEEWESRPARRATRKHTATVTAAKMYRRDLPAGRRDLHGLITLWARKVSPTVWEAVWARKSVGVSWRIQRGYIARWGDSHEYAHAQTVGHARGVLTRRMGDGLPASPSDVARLAGQVARQSFDMATGNIMVRERDAKAAGACLPGIRAWRNVHIMGEPMASVIRVAKIAKRDRDRWRADMACRAAAVAILRTNVLLADGEDTYRLGGAIRLQRV